MKIGLIGLPQAGKKTLFELLTNHKPSEKELVSGKPIKGVAEIKDPRFDKLVSMYAPKKEVMARIDIETLPKLEKDTIAKGEIFTDTRGRFLESYSAGKYKDSGITIHFVEEDISTS